MPVRRDLSKKDVLAQQQEARAVRRAIACNTCGWHTGQVVWSDSDYRLIACDHCRLVSLDPLPEEEDDHDLYDENYYTHYYLAFADRRRRYFRRRVSALVKRGAGARLLDVGCGVGLFLAEAMARGFAVEGVEPAPYAVAYAQKILGLPIAQGTLLDVDFQTQKFDVVTFWDVLGHIRNPHETVEKAAQVIEDSGMLVIKVPIRSPSMFWLARTLQSGADAKGLLHVPVIIHHYNRDSLSALLRTHGFEVTSHERINEPRTGGRLSHSRWKHILMRVFLSARHLVGLRDSLVVYARKSVG